ncbi:hypothetical protein BS78_08G030800 [Paspalum vaginatum]|nr:hypothetical protein BS78_08G030800 [Paspalum vaginatum]
MQPPSNNDPRIHQSPTWPTYAQHTDLKVRFPAQPQPGHIAQSFLPTPMCPPLHQSPRLQYEPQLYFSNMYASQPLGFNPLSHHPNYAQPPPPPYAATGPSGPYPSCSRRKTAKKGQSSRSRSPPYTVSEDKALCYAFLNVSRDPIVGANQTSDTADSLSHRWRLIAKEAARFCGTKARIDHLRESGKTENDRDTRKQQDWIEYKKAKFAVRKDTGDSTDDDSDTETPQEIPGPIGRDVAKKRRSSATPSSSESASQSLFERMTNNRELKHQREIQWDIQERQLALQQKQIEIQREQYRIQREQWEWTRFQDENKIMLMDLNNCSEKAKEYFLSIQEEILHRRRAGEGAARQGRTTP